MSLLLDARRGSQTPRVRRVPHADSTAAGEEAIELSELAGQPLDPWQQLVVRDGMGQVHTGGRWRWAASRVGCWVPRQNGKGAIIEARVLAGMFLLREPLIIWSAHRYNTAQEGFLRIRRLIEQTPDLDRQVHRFWTAAGEQGVSLRTGERLRFLARSRTSGRGWGAPCVIWDEGQELTAEQVAAMLPTISAQPDSQIWIFGTPPTDQVAWCYGLRADGEAGRPRLVWLDWGADMDLDDETAWADRSLWAATNPALGVRISEETIEDELGPSGLGAEFPHERLGVWRPHATEAERIIPADLWESLAAPMTEEDRPANAALAMHVNPERTQAWIAFAGRDSDGMMRAGLTDRPWRPSQALVDRIVDLRQRREPVAIAVDTRSERLVLDLEKAGITVSEDLDEPEAGDLVVPTAADTAAAHGLFVDTVRAGALRHSDDAPVNAALARAGTRPLAGGTTWDGDAGPLKAVTLAVWAFESRAHLLVGEMDEVGVW